MNLPRPAAYAVFTLPYAAAFLAVGWLIAMRFPTGPFVTSTDLGGRHPFIQAFLPGERATSPGLQPDGWAGQRVTGDPVYFTARVPGPYEHVDVALEFRALRQPMIELGMIRDVVGKEIELAPIFSAELQEQGWRTVPGGYVRAGVSDERLRSPDPTGLAMWHASSIAPLLSDAAGQTAHTALSLRGAHDFYFVPAGGKLEATFTLQDVNRATGTTPIIFRVFRGETELSREYLSPSGSRDRGMGKPITHRLAIDKAEPGVYRVSVQAGNDIFLRGISTSSKRWAVGPRLYLADVVGYSTSTFAGRVWTNSRHLVLETVHGEGLQTVSLGRDEISIDRTHKTYRLDRSDSAPGPEFLKAPAGDVKIIGDGWFAFSKDAYFEPQPRRYTDGMRLGDEGVAGLLTSYQRPAERDGWFYATTSFSISPSQGNLRFVLAAPGIDGRQGRVDVRRITLTYRRGSFSWQDILIRLRQELGNAWRRLKQEAGS